MQKLPLSRVTTLRLCLDTKSELTNEFDAQNQKVQLHHIGLPKTYQLSPPHQQGFH